MISSSGTPIKFFHGIYLVYTRYILFENIYQVYTRYIPRTSFPNNIMFLSIRMRICLWWVLLICRMVLSRDGYAFLGSYMVLKKTMVYDWYIPSICVVYTWIMLILVWLMNYCKRNDETATTLQNSHVQIITKAGDTTALLKKHVLLSSFICQVYTRYMLVISLQQHACGPAGSPKRAWMFQTWTVCGSFLFLQPTARQLEAGACQSSTASWSHKHGCPCVMQGLDHWHIRMRRPASVAQHTCTEW